MRRLPLQIKNVDDVVLAAKNVYSESVVPIFQISNVTGIGIDLLTRFLNILKSRTIESSINESAEFHVDQTFNVYGFGLVVGGQLVKGKIKVGDKLFIGPIQNQYETVVVKSIHCKKVAVQDVECGKYVCIGLKKKMEIKRGQVLVGSQTETLLVKNFLAEGQNEHQTII